ncbi:TP53-binding protein 1-like [Rhincodon typus]|uniref:TP53-binding protein 1-like n=1 Tax=Rhincodon typus TaxID=259920 RepID=UPI002030355E|nr:TP53-binding protein 1-like [Rhincodon typus]
MDPNGTQLESELSQQDTPCLIVEDSQAESVLSEDDPDQSYRNLQARCLSNLQTRTRSPVLELIAGPQAAKTSAGGDKEPATQKEMHHKVLGAMETVACQKSGEPSIPSMGGLSRPKGQSHPVCVRPSPQEGEAEDARVADSTTNSVPAEDLSQAGLGLLELPGSQGSDPEESANKTGGSAHGSEEINVDTCSEEQEPDTNAGSAGLTVSEKPLTGSSHLIERSEITSSVSTWQVELGADQEARFLMPSGLRIEGPPPQPGPERSKTVLAEKDAVEPSLSGPSAGTLLRNESVLAARVDHLQVLHLSGQQTLVQESLSESSNDVIDPSQESFGPTPIIVPSSPTKQDADLGNGDGRGGGGVVLVEEEWLRRQGLLACIDPLPWSTLSALADWQDLRVTDKALSSYNNNGYLHLCGTF